MRVSAPPAAVPAIELTFDDGPDPVWTPAVLRALEAIGARATFYVVAPLARRHGGLVRSAAAAGHEIGLHCLEHVRHSARARHEVERDADRALDLLAGLGISPRRWRTPWGDTAEWSGEVAARRGLRVCGWSADTHDWRGDAWRPMLASLRATLRPGGVVLMHDALGPGARRSDCRETVALLGPLADWVRARGWALAPLERPA
jgi:peptidoglycan/xylan/chitin deacetylase (PgdA/CDA1 family)